MKTVTNACTGTSSQACLVLVTYKSRKVPIVTAAGASTYAMTLLLQLYLADLENSKDMQMILFDPASPARVSFHERPCRLSLSNLNIRVDNKDPGCKILENQHAEVLRK